MLMRSGQNTSQATVVKQLYAELGNSDYAGAYKSLSPALRKQVSFQTFQGWYLPFDKINLDSTLIKGDVVTALVHAHNKNEQKQQVFRVAWTVKKVGNAWYLDDKQSEVLSESQDTKQATGNANPPDMRRESLSQRRAAEYSAQATFRAAATTPEYGNCLEATALDVATSACGAAYFKYQQLAASSDGDERDTYSFVAFYALIYKGLAELKFGKADAGMQDLKTAKAALGLIARDSDLPGIATGSQNTLDTLGIQLDTQYGIHMSGDASPAPPYPPRTSGYRETTVALSSGLSDLLRIDIARANDDPHLRRKANYTENEYRCELFHVDYYFENAKKRAIQDYSDADVRAGQDAGSMAKCAMNEPDPDLFNLYVARAATLLAYSVDGFVTKGIDSARQADDAQRARAYIKAVSNDVPEAYAESKVADELLTKVGH